MRGAATSDPHTMKLTATIVLSFQARTLAEAGAKLDEVLAPARTHDDVEVRSVDLQTPSGAPPVTLPHATPPHPAPPIGPCAEPKNPARPVQVRHPKQPVRSQPPPTKPPPSSATEENSWCLTANGATPQPDKV